MESSKRRGCFQKCCDSHCVFLLNSVLNADIYRCTLSNNVALGKTYVSCATHVVGRSIWRGWVPYVFVESWRGWVAHVVLNSWRGWVAYVVQNSWRGGLHMSS